MSQKKCYGVTSLEVRNLWGQSDFRIEFYPNVNIIIGPNGCGKTTILNLLRYVLTLDVFELSHLEFDEVRLRLGAFGGSSRLTVAVQPTDSGFRFKVSRKIFDISLDFLSGRRFLGARHRFRLEAETRQLSQELEDLVPAVWLPVTRRLPIPEEETDFGPRQSRGPRLESVDQRLLELVRELSAYRFRLDAQLSQIYKEFERRVLSLILYSKEDEEPTGFGDAPTEEEKDQLVRSFRDAGLLDASMRDRIDEHFAAAAKAVRSVARREREWEMKEFWILPLIPRTKKMVDLATNLERQRTQIFAPLDRFTRIVNKFLNNKEVLIGDDGKLTVKKTGDSPGTFKFETLSSGEKQILILLIEALLREGTPAVYVADEPELSLHVEWQEMLLASIVDLAREVQIIVATHSPDIVGHFQDNVINLGEVS